MVEAALRELPPLQYLDSGLALCTPVSKNSARPSRRKKELQGSKFGGEQALACSPYFSMLEAAFRELPPLQYPDSGLALCRLVSNNSARPSCRNKELQGSKIGGEQALAYSPYFSILEAALRELPPLQYLDSGLALCRPVTNTSAQPSRRKKELQG